jgi:hypothetical protein
MIMENSTSAMKEHKGKTQDNHPLEQNPKTPNHKKKSTKKRKDMQHRTEGGHQDITLKEPKKYTHTSRLDPKGIKGKGKQILRQNK